MPTFLFRRGPRHVFITTEDPACYYKILCGHCDYPLEQADTECPRCRRALEDCPVCSEKFHRKVTVAPPVDSKSKAKLCPSCNVRRVPFGISLAAERASFCTNLYGCPAGGMLLATTELAFLPENARHCPICHDSDLRPLPVATFLYHMRRCVFCCGLFADRDSIRGWAGCEMSWRGRPQVVAGRQGPCPICGRNDVLEGSISGKEGSVASHAVAWEDDIGNGASTIADASQPHSLTMSQYARVVELAHILLLQQDMDEVLYKLQGLWLSSATDHAEARGELSIAAIVDALICGTLNGAMRRQLHLRLDPLTAALESRSGISSSHRVASHRPAGQPPVPPEN
jgi:hypothetical protein